MSHPRRGDLYWVNLDPVIDAEIAKTRPAVIISNAIGNEFSARVIVAPLTTAGQDKVYPVAHPIVTAYPSRPALVGMGLLLEFRTRLVSGSINQYSGMAAAWYSKNLPPLSRPTLSGERTSTTRYAHGSDRSFTASRGYLPTRLHWEHDRFAGN